MLSTFRRIARLLKVIGILFSGLYQTLRYFPKDGQALSTAQQKRMHAWFVALLKSLNVRVESIGTPPPAGALFISNHISWLDIPVLGSLAPVNFVSKDDVQSWPLIGTLVTRSGTLYIKRGGNQTSDIAQVMSNAIAEKRNVAFFPEGTTTEGNTLRTFHPRLFEAARLGDHRVQPIALRYIDAPHVPYVGDQSLVANIWALCGATETCVQVHWCEAITHTQTQARKQLSRQSQLAIQRAMGLNGEAQIAKLQSA